MEPLWMSFKAFASIERSIIKAERKYVSLVAVKKNLVVFGWRWYSAV
jgi:hypothetical protein